MPDQPKPTTLFFVLTQRGNEAVLVAHAESRVDAEAHAANSGKRCWIEERPYACAEEHPRNWDPPPQNV